MANLSYGSHPSRLTDFLGSLDSDDRRLTRLLNREENREVESISLNRLPQTSWGTIDWTGISSIEQHPARTEVEAAHLFAQLVVRYVEADSEVVLLWGNLVVPSVALPARVAAANAEEVLATSHDVWLFAVDERILVEYFHEGRLTVVKVPAEPEAIRS